VQASKFVLDSGMQYIHLPPYSPDFQPIEELFHHLKDWIRQNYRDGWAAMDCVNGPAHPFVFLMEGLDSVSCEGVEGFFHDTGYPIM
jgi:transposase